jgi:hypothetical protein
MDTWWKQLEVSVARKQNEYGDRENFEVMFGGLHKDIGIAICILAIVVPPVFLLVWIFDLIVRSIA